MGSNSLAKTESGANKRATEQIGHSPRPEPLFPLFAPLPGLPGVGPATARRLARLLGRTEPRCLDLVAHLPIGLIDPEPLATLRDAAEGDAVTLEILVHRHHPAGGGRAPSRIDAEAAGERIELAFFGARGDTLERRFPAGERRLVHGRLGRFRERWQLTHPELIETAPDGTSVPIYRLSEGLTQGGLRRIVRGALDRLPPLPEWLAPETIAARTWPAWNEALRQPRTRLPRPRTSSPAHRPASASPTTSFWPGSWRWPSPAGVGPPPRAGRWSATAISARGCWPPCPTRLTACQDRAIAEIGCRPRGPGADDPPPAGRCRQRQDTGGVRRHAAGGRGRRPGGPDGADRGPGAPARGDADGPADPARHRARAADRLRAGLPPPAGPAPHRRGPGADRRRHPCPLPGRRRLPGPGPCRGRRAAPVRRRAAAGAAGQGRGRRPAPDERHADPAHPAPGGPRRCRGLVLAHQAARPAADRDQPRQHGADGRAAGRHRACPGRGRAGLLDLPPGRGLRSRRPDRSPGTPCQPAAAVRRNGGRRPRPSPGTREDGSDRLLRHRP